MECHQSAWIFLFFLILSFSSSRSIRVQGECLNDQRALLIQLNQSLTYDYYFSQIPSKRSSWSLTTDCCTSWDGITCDEAGHVISLDLSSEGISSGLNNSDSLFNLQYLESLNMADNEFLETPIPSGLDRLASLNYLNLSSSRFWGQIPIDISYMTKLVTLDLSDNIGLELSDPDFKTLTRNLTGLRELLIEGVSIYDVIPEFFGEFYNLTSLSLINCELYGKLPEKIFQLQALRSLHLSGNEFQGSLPEFPRNGVLQELVLRGANFSGKLPNTIGNLRMLSRLDLGANDFNGSIPASLSQLNRLRYLDLSYNRLAGSISSDWNNFTLLEYLDVSHNSLAGLIPSGWNRFPVLEYLDLSNNLFAGLIPSRWNRFPKLQYLSLINNSVTGTIPMALFTQPSILKLYLAHNQFTGLSGEYYSSSLELVDLRFNKLQGHFPTSFFEMSSLKILALSSNNFSGVLGLEMVFYKLRNLTRLYLSDSGLSINTTPTRNNISLLFPQVQLVELRSCKLTQIPLTLEKMSGIINLDLSNNQIRGEIPNWIWKIGNGTLSLLNLSFNFLEDPDQPFPINSFRSVRSLDLRSNKLKGNNLILPAEDANYLDYSFNNFTSMIPFNNFTSIIPDNVSDPGFGIDFFSLSNNQISGEFPASICRASDLKFLDLSRNKFSGIIHPCLGSLASLVVLNLIGNNFQGFIPDTFPKTCHLEKIDLNANKLSGQLPKSLANCTKLQLLDVGNNQLTGTFPSWLGNMSMLRVLVLQSNKFYGPLGNEGTQWSLPLLQIIDISSNKFSGFLSEECFSSWNAMMVRGRDEFEYFYQDQTLGFRNSMNLYNSDTVTITSKGLHMELEKILTSNTVIDFSNNGFGGEIPKTIGNLRLLRVLNFSRNALTGPIPSTIGNITKLESLDLSRNMLTGEIPSKLAQLSFLSVLNLSFNKLEGKIPSGSQFQTFLNASFEGNYGLCGPPMSKPCSSNITDEFDLPQQVLDSDEFDWVLFVVTFLGFVLGASLVIAPQYFWKRGREWANERINRILHIS